MCSEPSSTEKQDNTSILLQYGHLLKSIACFVLIQINCNFLLSIYNNGTCIYNHELFLLEIKGLTNKISFEYKSYNVAYTNNIIRHCWRTSFEIEFL